MHFIIHHFKVMHMIKIFNLQYIISHVHNHPESCCMITVKFNKSRAFQSFYLCIKLSLLFF